MGVRSLPGGQCLLFTEPPTRKEGRRGWRLRGVRTVRETGKQEAGPRAWGRCSGRETLSPTGSPSRWGVGLGPTAALHLQRSPCTCRWVWRSATPPSEFLKAGAGSPKREGGAGRTVQC